ncbi:Peptidoglycan/LPS O-acetylase OafA/YrhL, contains acyltransferase and SGNH-hydrolase domains [Gordonia malaquae]|uniref:Putative acyltransferase n=1 Tax=Gordonia malaquae NBRC 108250 TaxID=1223542 RepID=M3UWA1_GORML|nr:acyltransferase [Gordonia malaquae]GAC79907.1 putative acyltransferase [Gordonia malaquae NBRC 108250]SEB80158.1 Peptidoglycan/LPS O-acetylase OafA/YrhL, contains acyltransferase and SGNH-hydrolase domains [Gordonia malaquae]
MSDTETGTPEKKPAKKDRHLYQIDFVRLVTFAGVILDHVILGMAPYTAIIAEGVGLVLRYTRYCFFALTGFVLTYQYRNRDLHAPTFWRRRFKLIGLPFLVWSLFYWLKDHYDRGGVSNVFGIFDTVDTIQLALKSIAYDLVTGRAEYHLYFLSVSMQIYVVFPAVLWVIKRTWGYHRYLLALSAAVQAWFMFQMVRDYPTSFLGIPVASLFEDTWLGVLWRNLEITLLPYQFFVFAGCIAAYHFEAFTGFMKKYRFYIVGLSVSAIIATLAYFAGKANQAVAMQPPAAGAGEMFRATNVFMFHNVFLFLSVICLLFIGGMTWQARRRPGSLADTVLRKGSDRSFAIYLAHAVVLSEVMSTSRRWTDLSLGVNIVVTFVLTVALTVFLAETLRRSPVSLITTGREREDWRKQTPAKSAVVAIGAIVVGGALREWANTSIGSLIAAIGVLLLWSAAVVAARQLSETREERAADRAAALAEPEPSLVDEIEDPVTDIPVDDETPARVTDKKD